MKTNSYYLYTEITGNQINIKGYEFGTGNHMLYLQGGIHGGEVTYFVFQQIFEYLKNIEDKLNFKILLLPIINPISWQQRVYYYPIGKFSLQNGQDFNRHYSEKDYEGNGIAKKLANLLYNVSKDYKIALDFHTARHSKPYLYVEDKNLINLANLIGLELNLLDYELNTTEFSGFYVNKMRENPNATQAFTVECGSHDEYNADNIAEVRNGIIRLVNKLIEFKNDVFTHQFQNQRITYCKPKKWAYAPITGFAKFYKQPRELFKKGDLLVELYSATDLNNINQIFAQEDGIVIQHTKTHIFLEGDELFWYGVPLKKILFVCKGNTCRSPIASFIATEEFGLYLQTDSAGIEAENGKSASQNTIDIVNARYPNANFNHTSKHIDLISIEDYEFIIAMDKEVYDNLTEKYPTKIIQNWNIADPFEKGLHVYEITLKNILSKIQEFTTQNNISQ